MQRTVSIPDSEPGNELAAALARLGSRIAQPATETVSQPSGAKTMEDFPGLHVVQRNQLARCLCGQTFCGRLQVASLQSCEMRVQMRPRPDSREIGRSVSATCPLPPATRALAQCERADNTRSGSCRLHSRTAVAACAVLVRPPLLWQQGKRPHRPSCAPILSLQHGPISVRLRRSKATKIARLTRRWVVKNKARRLRPMTGPRILSTRNRPISTHDRNPPAVTMSPRSTMR